MSCFRALFAVWMLVGLASKADAQAVLQLPVFQLFTVNTTVSVPDSGRGFLGGVNRARSGRVSRGVPLLSKVPVANRLFKNHGIGSERTAANIGVTAKVLDLREMDEAVLAEAARRRAPGARETLVLKRADFINRHVARRPRPVPARPKAKLPSVEEIRRRTQLAQRRRQVEAVKYFEDARKSEARGKKGAAKVFYKMAAKRATGKFKQQILASLETLQSVQPQPALATK